jgi:hypothetical protein
MSSTLKHGTATSSRPKTAPTKHDSNLPPDIDLIHYLYYISQQKVGLQHHQNVRRPPVEFRDSYNLNHPGLQQGQKTYLNNLCKTYSIKDAIGQKRQQYIDLLKYRKTTGI